MYITNKIKNQIHLNKPFIELIREKENILGLTDADVYKKANIDSRTFNKYINNNIYPNKDNCLKIALVLEMDINEIKDLLSLIDKAFNKSDYKDMVIECLIKNGINNIREINDYLIEVYDLLPLI